MNRFLELTLSRIGILILTCTLLILTLYSIHRIILYIGTIKETKGKGIKFSDYMWLLFRIAITGLFIYDWGIFFEKMYNLLK